MNGASASASPRSRVATCDVSEIITSRLAAAPLRFPFDTASPSTFTCTYIVCGSSSSTVTTHGPIAIGTPSAVDTGAPLASRAVQSLTSV